MYSKILGMLTTMTQTETLHSVETLCTEMNAKVFNDYDQDVFSVTPAHIKSTGLRYS